MKRRLKPDGRITLLGDRSCTWLDDAEQSEWAGLEEPFAILHKVTLHTIKLERDRDAAARKPTYVRRTAAQLYQKVASTVDRIVQARWASARATRHHDSGRAVARFRKLWQGPGLARISHTDHSLTLLLFMSEQKRNKWKAKTDGLRSRHYRNQRFAPPQQLPEGTVSIFTDGSAEPRKLGQLFPPAGYGVTAVRGGDGHEHKGQYQTLLKMCGRVGPQTPNVETATNNSAELVAFTRALQWAKQSVHTQDPNTPVVLRYDSCYAAMIASGSWKAHAHKALAKEARKAWDDLLATKGERLWLRHVKGHSRHVHNNTADNLANQGRGGQTRMEEVA